MNYNKELAKVFNAAQKKLSKTGNDGKHIYICHAINDIDNKYDAMKLFAQVIINNRLDGCYTVDDWLRTNIKGFNRHKFKQEVIQKYRHAWLTELIKEFES